MDKSGEFTEGLKDKFGEFVHGIKQKGEDFRQEVDDQLAKGKKKFEEAKKDIDYAAM